MNGKFLRHGNKLIRRSYIHTYNAKRARTDYLRSTLFADSGALKLNVLAQRLLYKEKHDLHAVCPIAGRTPVHAANGSKELSVHVYST